MKKLGKLNLKKEKMLSHEELVSFRGGSDVSKKCCQTTWNGQSLNWTCYAAGTTECPPNGTFKIGFGETTSCNTLSSTSDACEYYG